jgi:predicted double-glycine peptidase
MAPKFTIGMAVGLIWVAASLSCAAPPASLEKAEMQQMTGWLRTTQPVRTWKELRDRNVVLQKFDYSCGAGALATLLRYYFGDPVSEEAILAGILDLLTPAQILDREANGLSLLDLKHYAERKGYQAVGVKLGVTDLKRLQGPVLIHLEREGYKHFAVLKGLRGDRIELADPSRGNVRMSIARFIREWSGVALILGKKGFGLPQDHPLAPTNPASVQMQIEAGRRSLLAK